MKTKHLLLTFVVATLLIIMTGQRIYSQGCTINAGGPLEVCGSSVVLTGSAGEGTAAGNPTWTFISGPTTPTIVSPNTFVTNVTGMTVNGAYTFQISHPCATGSAQNLVTITARARPAEFTAGPDKTNICATTGTTNLEGVIPAGFTGSWSAVNIAHLQRYGSTVSTNSSFSNSTIGNPDFSLINKANHQIDPAYYAILTIVSNDGVCTYKDTTVVRFCPNPDLKVVNVTKCINPSIQFFLLASPPSFISDMPGAAGAAGNGTTVEFLVESQPAGGNIAFDHIADDRIIITGAAVIGSYKFRIKVTNCCGTSTSELMTYTVTGINSSNVNFQPTGHGAPEQLIEYASGGSGGEVHCGIANTSTPENFYFSINAADDPAYIVSKVTSSGILPPGASTPIITHIGNDGSLLRTVSVDPGSSGWKVGTYKFSVSIGTALCLRTHLYYIHISDGARVPLFVSDTTACYPGTGVGTATIKLPAVYQGKVNSSYFQDFAGRYEFEVISKPSGAGTPTFTTANLRMITSAFTTISNLDTPGEYTIRIKPYSGNLAGPFIDQEYACSGIPAPLFYDFKITLIPQINSNAGSDQSGICANSVTLLGNATGSGTGKWTVVSAPVGATPVISAPTNISTPATHLTEVGEYLFAWTITSAEGCTSVDTVSYKVTCALPVKLTSFSSTKESGAVVLGWTTTEETNSAYFEVQHSIDSKIWTMLEKVISRGESTVLRSYGYSHVSPSHGANYYRLKMVDKDETYAFSRIISVNFDGIAEAYIYPNPTSGLIKLAQTDLSKTVKVEVIGMNGKVIYQTTIMPKEGIDLKKIAPKGIYMIKVQYENGSQTLHRIVTSD